MQRRIFLKTATLGAATLAFPSLLRAQGKEPIRIGFPLPLTGPFAAIAGDMKQGAELAVDELNAKNGILGRNAARAYNFDPNARFNEISCDQVNALRQDSYLSQLGTERESAPLATHKAPGARTRREVMDSLVNSPWSP